MTDDLRIPSASRLSRFSGSSSDSSPSIPPPLTEEKIVEVPTLAVSSDGTIPAKGFQITRTGLMRYPDASEEDWVRIGKAISMLQDSIQWLIGDWLLFGETVHGVSYNDAAERIGRDIGTVYNWKTVCASVDFSRRREKLSFTHHAEIAALSPEQQDVWLSRAETEGWSSGVLRAEVRKSLNMSRSTKEHTEKDDFRWLYKNQFRRDVQSRTEIRNRIAKIRQWLDDVEQRLEDDR